jgi:hypothetical protein
MDQVPLTGTPTSEEEEYAVPEKGYDFPLFTGRRNQPRM